ncbi:hypothetical protein FRB90_009034 [Tulasnella sp. 427]|nr:hypothetical protein FRB90_009034 [Tulasnella sp. 427]
MGDKLILGVFSQDWSMVVTVPVITGAEAALQCLAYWLDCARQTDTVSPLHVPRPGAETRVVWFPNESDNALPPSRIARLLDQSSQRASASTRNTRSRTVARKAFVSYDDKTGRPIVTQLADDHVEDMRAKSLMMRTGDEAGWNISINAQSSGNSAESEQHRQSDPETKMDTDPQTSPDLDLRTPSLVPQELADPGADFDQVSLIEPGNDEKAVFTWDLKREHFYKWHREHFSTQDDLDRSDPWSYLKLANAKFN